MRALYTVAMLAIAATWCSGQEAGKKDEPAAQKMTAEEMEKATPHIKTLSKDLLHIAISRDPKVLERVMAKDVLIVDPEGKLFTRDEETKLLESGQFKATIADMKTEEHQVKFFGRTAVVTGVSKVKGTFKGKDISGTYRFNQVFMDRGQGWQMVTCLSNVLKE
jgi:ketosteroid isomerase-like protein